VALLQDRGIRVEQRKITLSEVREGMNSGEIAEAFACGTAAVITPIGQLISAEETIGVADSEPGELTVSLRQELTGIQYGRVQDRHGWMHKLGEK